MSIINIRGYIADAEYDGTWADPYIERGLWTPDSRVRRELAAANKAESLTVRVSSPGGSVFAGYEMANAIRDWARETGQAVNVEVGSLAASMGAYLAFFLSGNVAIHRNTKAMFHGVWGATIGGKEAHEDAAALMAKMNAEIKGELVARGVAPELADEWLAEGRMGWLNAEELLGYKMARNVIDADALAEKPDATIMEGAIKAAQDAGKLALAAALTEEMTDGCDKPGDTGGEPAAAGEPAAGAAVVYTDAGAEVEPLEAQTSGDGAVAESTVDAAAEMIERVERLTAERDAAVASVDAAKAATAAAQDALRALQSKHDKLIAETKALRTEHDALRARWDRLTGAARAATASTDQTAAGGANGGTVKRTSVGIWKK